MRVPVCAHSQPIKLASVSETLWLAAAGQVALAYPLAAM
jgi:hypothetical protein